MNFLREPLLHFLLVGAVLFGVFRLADPGGDAVPGEIVVSAGRIASMQAIFSRTWQRPPTAKETQALVDEYVRDEVLYRTGVAMGLDQDDAVIRRRVRQKVEFVADLASDVEPTEAELRAFMAVRPEMFRSEPRFSFSHVYFASGKDGPSVDAMERLREALNAGAVDASKAGNPFLPGSDFLDVTRSAVAQTFGENFAAWIDRSGTDGWEGPVRSAYGTHLVHVSGRVEARDLPFEEVRETARREWLHGRKLAASYAHYEKLRSRYTIRVEDGPAWREGEKLAEAVP